MLVPELTYQHPEPHRGEAPPQEIHFVDGGELQEFERDGFGFYLGAALTLTSTGLSVGATLVAWHFSIPAKSGVTGTIGGLICFALTFLVFGAGIALFFPGIRNWSSNKSLVTKIRKRLIVPGPGEQQTAQGGTDLPPVTRNPAALSQNFDDSEDNSAELTEQ